MGQATLRDFLGPNVVPGDAPRLGRVDRANLEALADGAWRPSTALKGLAVHSSIARLRKAGHLIESRRDPEAPTSGVWQYRRVS